MELRHLRYFVAVAEAENVTRAAGKLHVSQPGLSRQIRDLEDEIGFLLLERSAKAVRLTEAGRTFLIEARAVLQRAEEAVQTARAVAGKLTGELHVGYAPSLTVRLLPQALRVFQAEFPNVRVALHDLSSEEMFTQLNNGKLQIALTVPHPGKAMRGLAHKMLARYAMCIAVAPGHPLAKAKSVTLAQLADEPLIGYSRVDYPGYEEFLEKTFSATGRVPRLMEEHDGIASVIAAVESGRGYALVPDSFACMVGPRLKIIPLNPKGEVIPVAAIWKKDSATPLMEKFIAAASED